MDDNSLVNMQAVKDKISERVKTSFFELLPDDKFKELVDKEIKAFFEATSEEFLIKEMKATDGWSRSNNFTLTTPISPFRAIIWAEC